ncbi:GNAT family N-acetyltransferase [Sphingobacterium sp.]|uniref:GNAT family N-acetyltransferase n=1 Tax=Sphingobacterium sp. TaxID=341027 RepID=UPI00289FFC24|nr:GNAT family N-acetyltransferase [Sphingobacterium sp.]
MIHIERATEADASVIRDLALATWYPTYSPVLEKAQIDFMLEQSYSVAALQEGMREGAAFYLFLEDGIAQGFMSLSTHADKIRIDKLYLLPATQGRGFGKLMIDFAAEEAQKQGLSILELNVNRNNKAYHFYLKQGFEVVETVDIPYYQFVLNDYVMQKNLIS